MSQIIGEIIQVIGPVVDVSFEKATGELPRIHDALEIKRSGGQSVILEVQQDIGENTLRTIAMDSTDGLQRGMTVTALGSAIRLSLYDTPTLVHFCSTSHKNTPTLVHFYATSHKSTLTSVRFYATSHKSTSMSVRFYATSLYDTPTSVYFCATSVYETPTSVSATS